MLKKKISIIFKIVVLNINLVIICEISTFAALNLSTKSFNNFFFNRIYVSNMYST